MEKPSTNEYEELVARAAGTLNRIQIPYYITGGAAVVTWGKPRFTWDVDIVVELFEDKISTLVEALKKELGEAAYVDEAQIRSEWERQGEFNVVDGVTGVKVDFFFRKRGPIEDERLRRVRTETIVDVPVKYISPEDLILQKFVWHRESGGVSTRHIEDAESVLRMRSDTLEWEYLNEWADRLDVGDDLKEILKD